jgi:hypothetical protein
MRISELESTELEAKQHILEDAGYRYNFDRRLYVNRKVKKAFSIQFIEDNPASVLGDRVLQPSEGREWKFYFSGGEPSESVRRQLEIALG